MTQQYPPAQQPPARCVVVRVVTNSPFGVDLAVLVFDHLVSGDVGRVACDVQLVERQSVVHVVVLAAPAPVLVTEAVHQLKLGAVHRRHAAKQLRVRQSARGRGDTRGTLSGGSRYTDTQRGYASLMGDTASEKGKRD